MSASMAARSSSRAGRNAIMAGFPPALGLPGSIWCRLVRGILGVAAAGRFGQDVGDRELALVAVQRELGGLDSHDVSGDADRHVEPGPFEVTFQKVAEPRPRGIGMPDAQTVQRGIEDLVRVALVAKMGSADGR